MPKITIPQKNTVLDVPEGTNLMSALRDAGIPVASSCLGDGICGKCRMEIIGSVTAPDRIEIETGKRNKLLETERLACQIKVESDLTVTTTYW